MNIAKIKLVGILEYMFNCFLFLFFLPFNKNNFIFFFINKIYLAELQMTIKNASFNEFLLTEFEKYNIYTRKYVFILKFDIEKKR